MKIEKNIPIPTAKCGNDKGYRRLLRSMEVKDSVKFEGKDADRITNVISFFHARGEMRFTTRKEENGKRIWRIE